MCKGMGSEGTPLGTPGLFWGIRRGFPEGAIGRSGQKWGLARLGENLGEWAVLWAERPV